MKKVFLSLMLIVCLLLTVSSIQAMSIQRINLTCQKINLSQQLIPNPQSPLIDIGKNRFSLSNQLNATPMAILPPSTGQWVLTFGSLESAEFSKTNDNGYLVIGNNATGNLNLIKINSNGGYDWARNYNIPNYSFHPRSAQQTLDNGYIICGYTYLVTNIQTHLMFALKVDSLGNGEWLQIYNFGTLSLNARDIKQLSDGGYVITGNVNDTSVLLARTDSNGIILWASSFSENTINTNGECGMQVLIDQVTGNIVVFSKGSSSMISDIYNFYKFDLDGVNLLYVNYAGWVNAHSLGQMIQTQDNGFALVGTRVPYQSQYGYALVKLSNTFQIAWQQDYPTSGNMNTVGIGLAEIPGDGFVLTGAFNYAIGGLYSISLVKVDSTGNLEWMQNNWELFGTDTPFFVDYTNDGGFVIGSVSSESPGTLVYSLIKLI